MTWQLRAACRGEDPEIFYSFGSDAGRTELAHEIAQQAKAICRPCPVKEECLEWALAKEDFGVWGETTAYERRQIREKRATETNSQFGGTCSNGHKRTAETVRFNRHGQEYCQTCAQGRNFAVAAKARAAKTHCVRGHELTPENVIIDCRGHRACKPCHAERSRARRARRREARRAVSVPC